MQPIGSFYPCLHFAFFCHPRLQIFYIVSISLIGLGRSNYNCSKDVVTRFRRGVYRSEPRVRQANSSRRSNQRFYRARPRGSRTRHSLPDYRGLPQGALRTRLQLGPCIWSFLHLRSVAIVCLVRSHALDSSSFFSANRIPECLAPGKFDYFFASHQIFHCCVVAAAVAHYAGVSTALDYSYSRPNICTAISG